MRRAEEIGRERLTDFFLVAALARPKSIGSIRLKSDNYTEYPRIDPQYMSDERDVKTMVKGTYTYDYVLVLISDSYKLLNNNLDRIYW